MKKILLIIEREYMSKIKKKSFIIMTFLGPLLMAGLMIVPAFIATMSDNDVKKIAVVDETGVFYKKLSDTKHINFDYIVGKSISSVKDNYIKNKDNTPYYGILYIPNDALNSPSTIRFMSEVQPSMNVKIYIENKIQKEIEDIKLKVSVGEIKQTHPEIDSLVLSSLIDLPANIKTDVNIATIQLKDEGEEVSSSSEVATILGILSAFMIYMFIFMYGTQVMRGVMEEKTSRIVEIIVSSVKPFQLMIGKIVGIACVGLTQFILWVILTGAIVMYAKSAFPEFYNADKASQSVNISNNKLGIDNSINADDDTVTKPTENEEILRILTAIKSINYWVIILSFLFYFIGGYLLYASLFGAIGAACDNETDTQQFILPISMPLLLGIIMAQFIANNPQGPIAFWLSIIPFTSPIAMMIRIPFGVPVIEVILSAVLLIVGFLLTTWLAGKIYRTGILMYGKKITYSELFKWIKYKV
ncbi:MAG: hypothetical protein A2X12_10070 [Bacteroidetes bacterium GWE2_29_8]|nr:MAG: hypothetical protein A2X12_10070 [Bacteroidetes bacterium GWE2_29_8]OFY14145.1 MAG: hypothetical protein A2X02_02635 [Bacteroidetes bacterium GWF2_29_10]